MFRCGEFISVRVALVKVKLKCWPLFLFLFFIFSNDKGCLFDTLSNLDVLLCLCKVSQLLDYCEFNRFPRDQWDSALQFFLKKQEE